MRLHFVVPDGFDDPTSPSGGNHYDRRLGESLAELGRRTRTVRVPPAAGPAGLGPALAAIPDHEVVLLDGLLASPAADVLVPAARRLRLVVLLHMPLATAGPAGSYPQTVLRSEREVLAAAAAVVVPSGWTRTQLLRRYPLEPARVHVARPGVDLPHPGAPRRPAPAGPRATAHLLCVATLAPHKGQDLLIDALSRLGGHDWRCTLVGPMERDLPYAIGVRARIAAGGLDGRAQLAGTLTREALALAYASADLLLVPSRSETYGMVVTEALAYGLPVLAARVGGLPEALGHAPDGDQPGVLVAPGDPAALHRAIRRWLTDPEHRRRLRAAALARRATLSSWRDTAQAVAAALDGP